MLSKPHTTVCFSGHRYYLGDEGVEARLAEALEAVYRDGYRIFISGMAMGFDLAAAGAVVRLRERHPDVYLIAAVPFLRQADRYPAEDKAGYESILAAADETVVLSCKYDHGCFYRRNDWMVERSGRMICWYDGSKGGTRYTVRKAVAGGLGIVNLFRAEGTLFGS